MACSWLSKTCTVTQLKSLVRKIQSLPQKAHLFRSQVISLPRCKFRSLQRPYDQVLLRHKPKPLFRHNNRKLAQRELCDGDE